MPSDATGALVGRVKALRHATKSWAKQHRARPEDLNNATFIVLHLDVYEESRALSAGEHMLRARCRDRVSEIIEQRAAYWKQRGKFRALREGDANTKFFHARASGRARRNAIRTLKVDGELLISHDSKVAALTAYYTTILGGEVATRGTFDVDALYNDAARVEGVLTAPFKELEARTAVRTMASDSAPGPDGISPGFNKTAWGTVKEDVMSFLHAFHRGATELERVNRAVIVLLPKTAAATAPSSFRPVSLQNCPVKILTKLLTLRLQLQIARLIDPDQTGFIRGRSISENFVLTTKLVQTCHKRRAPTLVLKLDFAKAFDSVNWASLLRVLRAHGFPEIWCAWMQQLLATSKSAVLVNGIPGPWISCKRGLRQGDALSPYLFLLVADVL